MNAIHEYRELEREIEKLSKKRVDVAEQCSKEGLKGMDIPRYDIYRFFLQKVSDNLARARKSLKEAEEKIKEKKAVLKGESIKKKALETLKDLRRKKYILRLESEEQKTLDELVITKKGRRA